jgi:predicted acylesterase/phospholipase RssA
MKLSQALEELGLMKKIKRFAGTSVGSMTACMAALGYSSQEIRTVVEKDFRTFFGRYHSETN